MQNVFAIIIYMCILKVKYWITMYDPYGAAYYGYGNGSYAPGIVHPDTGPYTVGHNLIRAHSKVYKMYTSQYKERQKGMFRCLC